MAEGAGERPAGREAERRPVRALRGALGIAAFLAAFEVLGRAGLVTRSYLPPSSPVDRAHIVAASAPIPRGARPAPLARDNSVPATGIDTVATKGTRGADGVVTNSARIAAANTDGTWLRIVMLAPSVGASMQVTVLGDADLTLMRGFFVKPETKLNTVSASEFHSGRSKPRTSKRGFTRGITSKETNDCIPRAIVRPHLTAF